MKVNEGKAERELTKDQHMGVGNIQKILLEALRHREQEILRYIAILGPALGGFIWLLSRDLKTNSDMCVFTFGTLGVLFVLLVGAVYSLALGYNYRSILLQLAKLEACCLNIKEFIVERWPRTSEAFLEKCQRSKKPSCDPPEIIKVFWRAFVVGIVGVMVAAPVRVFMTEDGWRAVVAGMSIIISALVCLRLAMVASDRFGRKFEKACEKEVKTGKW